MANKKVYLVKEALCEDDDIEVFSSKRAAIKYLEKFNGPIRLCEGEQDSWIRAYEDLNGEYVGWIGDFELNQNPDFHYEIIRGRKVKVPD